MPRTGIVQKMNGPCVIKGTSAVISELEPLIVSEPGEDDDNRGAKQVVVEVVAEKASAAEQLSQSDHWSPLEVRPGEAISDSLWTMVFPTGS